MELDRFKRKTQDWQPAPSGAAGQAGEGSAVFESAWRMDLGRALMVALLLALSAIFYLIPGAWAFLPIGAVWLLYGLSVGYQKRLRLALRYGQDGMLSEIEHRSLFGVARLSAKDLAGYRMDGKHKSLAHLESKSGKRVLSLHAAQYRPALSPARDFAGLENLDVREESLALDKILGPAGSLPGVKEAHAKQLARWKAAWLALCGACGAAAAYCWAAVASPVQGAEAAAVVLVGLWPVAALALLRAKPDCFCLSGAKDPRIAVSWAFWVAAFAVWGLGLERPSDFSWINARVAGFSAAVALAAAALSWKSASLVGSGKDKLWMGLSAAMTAWILFCAVDALTLGGTGRAWELAVQDVREIGGKRPHLSVRLGDSGEPGAPSSFERPVREKELWKAGESAVEVEFSDAFGSKSYAFLPEKALRREPGSNLK